MAQVYRFLLFDRHYECRLDRKWFSLADQDLSDTETMQLIMGSTYSLKSMVLKLSPSASNLENTPVPINVAKEVCFTYVTSKYRLVYFETVTGWKLCLLLEPSASMSMPEAEQLMRALHSEILLKGILQSPMYRLTEPSFERPGILQKLDQFISTAQSLRLISN